MTTRGRGRRLLLIAAAILCLRAVIQAQDPVVVAPDIYHRLFENDDIRILRAVQRGGETSKPHVHPGLLVIMQTDLRLRVVESTGTTDVSRPVETIDWLDASGRPHAETNTSGDTSDGILVEFKKVRAAPAVTPRKPIAGAQTVIENAAVRVSTVDVRGAAVPGTGNRVVVFRSACATAERRYQRGDAIFLPAASAGASYGTDGSCRLVIVEIEPRRSR